MNFGLDKSNWFPNSSIINAKDQAESLKLLASLSIEASTSPLVRNVAVKIVRDCASRDDMCELQSIFNAVKHGDDGIEALKRGLKYVADPTFADYFESPVDVLENCARGACGSDCDGHAALIAALCASIGWKAGLRAWGRDSDGYSHVFAVVLFPKRPPHQRAIAMDTTVPSFKLGSEPPRANVLNAYF